MRRASMIALILWCATRLADAKEDMVVAADGSGNFRTIQEAIEAVPDKSPTRVVIRVRPGTYYGQIVVPTRKRNIALLGDDAHRTVITYERTADDPVREGEWAKYKGAGFVVAATGFRAERITFQNTAGDGPTAIALRVDGDRAEIWRCRILGWTNTLRVYHARAYFGGCYIEGRNSFISGDSTAVFDHCEIHSKNGGHVTAARHDENSAFGFVFLRCALTGYGEPADLGGAWDQFAKVVFVECQMGAHIEPSGWDSWQSPEREDTAYCAEYNTTGAGANPSKRVLWSKQLTAEQAGRFTVANVLAGKDNWRPAIARVISSAGLGGAGVGMPTESAATEERSLLEETRSEAPEPVSPGEVESAGGPSTPEADEPLEPPEPEFLHFRGYVTYVNPIRGRIRLESDRGKCGFRCHAYTRIFTETSTTLARIPSTSEVSVLGRWQGDKFRFERVSSFVIPALPLEFLGEAGLSGSNGWVVGDIDNLALKTRERIIPLNLFGNSNVVVMSLGNLSLIELGQRAEAWGRVIGKAKICDVLLVYGLSKRRIVIAQPTAVPSPKKR